MSIHQIIPIENSEYARLSLPTNEYTPDHSHWRPSTEYTPDHSRVEGGIKMTIYIYNNTIQPSRIKEKNSFQNTYASHVINVAHNRRYVRYIEKNQFYTKANFPR